MTKDSPAYKTGRAIALALSNQPLVTAFVCVVVVVAIYSSGQSNEPNTHATTASKPKSEKKCTVEKKTLLELSNKEKLKGNFYDAAYMLSECATELNDPELKSEFLENSVRHWREVVDSNLSTDNERSFAFKKLSELDTANQESHLKQHQKYEKLAEAKAIKDKAAAEAKAAKDRAIAEAKLKREKKSSGVHIGMTTQDVLDSSWGRPKKINRSVNEYGTREQWVYPGYNYLYFDDGILKTIHTSSN